MAEIRHSWCQQCGPGRMSCSILCTIEDGRWVRVEGNPDAGNNWGRGCRSLCAKGNAAMQALHSSDRILYPMKRTGEKGAGSFKRITWDEALDEMAGVLKDQKARYGAESFAILSPQFFPVTAQLGRRFLNVHGSPNYLHSGICSTQRRFSRLTTIGGQDIRQPTDTAPGQLDKTKLLVLWGANIEASSVNLGVPNSVLDAMERGLEVIDIRPMADPMSAKASQWVPVRPGTDCALALAILNVIIGEGLYDRDFVDGWCAGFDELAQHVARYTPAWAAMQTGVPEGQIRLIARRMGTESPMGIIIGNGVGDQQSDGYWAVSCICLIEAITGNLGIAGGGGAPIKMPPPLIQTRRIDVLSERLAPSAEDIAHGFMPGVSKIVAPETPRWFQTRRTQESGPTGSYFKGLMSVLSGEPYPLRFVLAQSTNPLSATRQPKIVAQALRKLDYYVAMDTHWNSSCDFADIVLPACTAYEASDQFGVKNSAEGTWIGIGQKIEEPAGESRSDWQFYLDFAVRMGYGDDFWGGDMDACLREQLEPSGISLDKLRAADRGIFVKREDGAQPSEPAYRDYARMFAHLPDGKVQCFNALLAGKPDNLDEGVLVGLPVYRGPVEGIAQTPEIARDYPLILSDVHADYRCQHSYCLDVPYLRELQPYPWVKMNPATARAFEVEEGDWVEVESPHGRIRLTAQLFDGIAPDVLMTRRGWWQPCSALGLEGFGCFDGGSEPNALYSDDIGSFDRFTSAMGKQTLVRMRKVDGPETVAPSAAGDAAPTRAKAAGGQAGISVEGRIEFDAFRCIGCRACVLACAQWMGAPSVAKGVRRVIEVSEGTFPHVTTEYAVRGCTDFGHAPCRVPEGADGAPSEPRCVASCPTKALSLVI